MKHEKFVPLSSPGGDGRNDIALLYIRTRWHIIYNIYCIYCIYCIYNIYIIYSIYNI